MKRFIKVLILLSFVMVLVTVPVTASAKLSKKQKNLINQAKTYVQATADATNKKGSLQCKAKYEKDSYNGTFTLICRTKDPYWTAKKFKRAYKYSRYTYLSPRDEIIKISKGMRKNIRKLGLKDFDIVVRFKTYDGKFLWEAVNGYLIYDKYDPEYSDYF